MFFTDIAVEIISEDGSKMSSAKHSSLSMKLWKVDNRSKNAPASRVNIREYIDKPVLNIMTVVPLL